MRVSRYAIPALLLAAAACATPQTQAAIIWDQSAVTAGGATAFVYSNTSDGQNFSEQAQFSTAVSVTGMDIYTVYFPNGISGQDLYGAVGTPVVIRIWSAGPSGPLQEFQSTISIRDFDGAPLGEIPNASPGGVTVRVFAALANPVALAAGSYWFGMSLAPNSGLPDLGMATMLGGTGPLLDGTLNQYNGTTLLSLAEPPIGDGQFRVWGDAVAVPEPGTLALLAIGLAGLALGSPRRILPARAKDSQ